MPLFQIRQLLFTAALCCALPIPVAYAQDTVPLLLPGKPALGWEFANGQEFPGATGGITIDGKRDGRDALKLTGDFTAGGKYVAALATIPDVDVREISLWVKNPGADQFKIRLVDGSGQTHQVALKTEVTEDWQRIVFPVERFFKNRAQADAVTGVTQYQYFGGAKDGNWHGPAKSLAILIRQEGDQKVRNFWISDVSVLTKPAEAAAVQAQVATTIPLDTLEEGETDWTFARAGTGPGGLTVVKDAPAPGQSSLQFSADLTAKGSTYAAMTKNLVPLELTDITAIRMKVRSDNTGSIGIQLIDGSGQTHQNRAFKIQADGQWHDVVIKPAEFAGGEHWGGANDGKWHGQPAKMAIRFNGASDPKGSKPSIQLANITADALQAAVPQAAAFQAGFENAAAIPADWKTEGNATIDSQGAFKGSNALVLSRVMNGGPETPTSATSPTFKVTPGQWQVGLAAKSDLKSPDSSYNGTVELELLDGGGKEVSHTTLAELYGSRPWQPVAKTIDVPAGVSSARLRTQLNKSEGKFWIDDVSAAFLAPAPKKDLRVARIVMGTASLGNMLLPDAPRVFDVTVEAVRPLRENQRSLTYEVRDYWGAEQMKPATLTLEKKEKKGDRFIYQGNIDLAKVPLDLGRYYELHASIPEENADPAHGWTALAILPEAITSKYKPEDVPFASRSWDNRSVAHQELTNRLGIRVLGIKGNWGAKAPYKASAPGIAVAQKYGMGWLTTTPIATIERGLTKYDETSLREGVKNLLNQYKDVRPLIINLGNEPHGTGEAVTRNVAAYKAVYEEIKKLDPSIFVLATSVEPNEEYFKAGYGQYCDGYDFHVYETPDSIRKSIQEYQALMKKYNVVKPIWATEIGLNSQGLPRSVIAADLFRKFTAFFAAGGSNITWFGLAYSDPDAKIYGTSGDSFNVFDSRYNRYSPRLDAIAYYNAVNSIAIKKFVAEKQYEDVGVHSTLFRDRDNRSLQVLWKDKGRADVSIPLAGATDIEVIRLDGSHHPFNPGGQAVTLTVSEEPLLLLYNGGPQALPGTLGAPAIVPEAVPATILRGGSASLTVALNGTPASDVNLQVPMFWTAAKTAATTQDGKPAVKFTVTAPAESDIRVADMALTVGADGKRSGEIYLRPTVAGQLMVQAIPAIAADGKLAGMRLLVENNGATPQTVTWDMALSKERVLSKGNFSSPASTSAYFAETPTGSLTVAPRASAEATVPLTGTDPLKVYDVKASITDSSGRGVTVERPFSVPLAVPRVKGTLKLDGVLDDEVWKNAPAAELDKAEQVREFPNAIPWKGPQGLSGTLQFAWDDKYFYAGIKVTDDIAGQLKEDSMLWAQDGLQFLFDPFRDSSEKSGKYDYSVAVGQKGPQAWRSLSADANVPTGAATDVQVFAKKPDATGATNYEIAFPWSSLAPFAPKPGADLGLALALNEDDGNGRRGFMTWFGDVHMKQVDTVGDLILTE